MEMPKAIHISGTIKMELSLAQQDLSLSSADTLKNDAIYLQATPFDGTSSWFSHQATIIVVNSAPGAPTVEIQPTDAEPQEPLTCAITSPSYDPDFDNITYTYQWHLGGALQSQYTTNMIGNTTHNEQWQRIVTPSDGTVTGGVGSDSIVVADTTSPDAPVLDAIDLYRNEGTITITGTAEAGSSVQLYNNCGQTVPLAFTVPPSEPPLLYCSLSILEHPVLIMLEQQILPEIPLRTQNYISKQNFVILSMTMKLCQVLMGILVELVDDWNILAPSSSATAETVIENVITPGDEDWYVIDTSQNVGSSKLITTIPAELTTGAGSYDITVYRGDCNASSLQ